jgi:hypothetical protein
VLVQECFVAQHQSDCQLGAQVLLTLALCTTKFSASKKLCTAVSGSPTPPPTLGLHVGGEDCEQGPIPEQRALVGEAEGGVRPTIIVEVCACIA